MRLRLPSPRAPPGLAFGKPKGELRAWRGGVGGGGRRLLEAGVVEPHRRFGASVGPPPLAQRLRRFARPSPPTGGRVAVAPPCSISSLQFPTAMTKFPNVSTSATAPGSTTVVDACSSISAGPSIRLPASR